MKEVSRVKYGQFRHKPFTHKFNRLWKRLLLQQSDRRIRNKAIFRDDNASLSQGQDKRWYFYFSLDEDQLEQLPDKLVRQAGAIAQKVLRELILKQQAV